MKTNKAIQCALSAFLAVTMVMGSSAFAADMHTSGPFQGSKAKFGDGLDVRTLIKALFPIALRMEVRASIRGSQTPTSILVAGFNTALCFQGVSPFTF